MSTITYILNKTSTFIMNSEELISCELKTGRERERASGTTLLLLFPPLSKSITLCKWSIDLYHLLSFVLITISQPVFVVIVNSRRLVYSKSAKIETHRQRQRGIQSEQQSDRQTDRRTIIGQVWYCLLRSQLTLCRGSKSVISLEELPLLLVLLLILAPYIVFNLY